MTKKKPIKTRLARAVTVTRKGVHYAIEWSNGKVTAHEVGVGEKCEHLRYMDPTSKRRVELTLNGIGHNMVVWGTITRSAVFPPPEAWEAAEKDKMLSPVAVRLDGKVLLWVWIDHVPGHMEWDRAVFALRREAEKALNRIGMKARLRIERGGFRVIVDEWAVKISSKEYPLVLEEDGFWLIDHHDDPPGKTVIRNGAMPCADTWALVAKAMMLTGMICKGVKKTGRSQRIDISEYDDNKTRYLLGLETKARWRDRERRRKAPMVEVVPKVWGQIESQPWRIESGLPKGKRPRVTYKFTGKFGHKSTNRARCRHTD